MSERMSLKQVVEQLDLVRDPRPPVEASTCSDLSGHSWTRAGGGGTCRTCEVRAEPRGSYKGSRSRSATNRQVGRVHQLAAMKEIGPDLAADVEDRVAEPLTERQATALIQELGGQIAQVRNVGESP